MTVEPEAAPGRRNNRRDRSAATVERISHSVRHLSKTWVVLSACSLFLVFVIIVLPTQAQRSEVYTQGAMSPDSSLFYEPRDLYRAAEAYGPKGRAAYVAARFTFDLAWPLVYALFLSTAMSWLFVRSIPDGSVWQRANLLPLLAAALDYLENVATSLVMVRYPARTPGVVAAAPTFTLLKWLSIGVSFGLLLAGASLGLWQVVRERTK